MTAVITFFPLDTIFAIVEVLIVLGGVHAILLAIQKTVTGRLTR